MTTTILSFILLSFPTVWELWNDKKGDLNKKRDVIIRALLMVSSALLCWCLLHQNFFASLNLSVAIFFLLFDYAINIVLYKNGVINNANWFSYTAKKGFVDNVPWWKQMNPWVKFGIRVLYFVGSIILYFTI